MLNAGTRRDFAVAAPIQIRAYADRLRIWNPDELPESWSEAKLRKPHSSRPFNPDVPNAFFLAGEIEVCCRGIDRIFEGRHQARTPEPKICVEPRDRWFEFPFSAAYLNSLVPGEGLDSAGRWTTQEATQKTTQERILALRRHEPTLHPPRLDEGGS